MVNTPNIIPNIKEGKSILKLFMPADFIDINSDSVLSLAYVISVDKNAINGIIVANNLGIIRIVRLMKILTGKPLIIINSINLRDCINQAIPVILSIIKIKGPNNCLKIYLLNKFNFVRSI